RDASGNYSYDNDKRFLYSTSAGLILSTNSLSEGSDLRYAYSMGSSSYDGPSRLLLKDSTGSSFSLPSGESILSLKVTRNASNNTDGYTLYTKTSTGTVTEFSFDLTGDLTSQSPLSATEISALELTLKSDLNNDSIVGVTVNTKLFDKKYDASGNYLSNTSDRRFLYSTSGGLLLSRDELTVGSDLRSLYSQSGSSMSTWEGPSLLVLKDANGYNYSIPSGQSVVSVNILRDTNASGYTAASGFRLTTKEGNTIRTIDFDLDGQLPNASNFTAKSLTQTLNITVTPVNDAPVATYSSTQNITQGFDIVSGQLTRRDVDNAEAGTYALVGTPIPGLTINANGSWTFDPADDAYAAMTSTDSQQIVVNYSVTDPAGATGNGSFTIALNGDPSKNFSPERLTGTVSDLTVDEDSGLTTLGLAGLTYSPGPGETSQTLSYTVTATPSSSLGQIGYLDSSNNFVAVSVGTALTLQQLQGLNFKTKLDAFGDSSFSFAVTDSDPTAGSTSDPIQTLTPQQAAALEFDLKVDLTGDSIVGLTVNSEVLSKDRDASGNYLYNTSDRRYLYNTSEGYLLSVNSLSTGSDLRNASTSTSAYDGPYLLLLKDANGNSFSDPSGQSVVSLTVLRDQTTNNVDGYDLLTKNSSGNFTEYFFSINGDLTGQNTPTALELASLELQTKTDLNSDGLVASNVSSKLFDKDYDASGSWRNNNSDLRFLYSTSFGLLLSRNSLSVGSDLRYA
ncbi:MAG: hypothetical protein FJ261_15910, partial [Planctomycetes bacterium]|nr:hypothetical protein [Planctomycetota bacterium]